MKRGSQNIVQLLNVKVYMHLTIVRNFTFQFIITSPIMSGSHNIAEILMKLMTNTNNQIIPLN